MQDATICIRSRGRQNVKTQLRGGKAVFRRNPVFPWFYLQVVNGVTFSITKLPLESYAGRSSIESLLATAEIVKISSYTSVQCCESVLHPQLLSSGPCKRTSGSPFAWW
jgi:hypothetical protein